MMRASELHGIQIDGLTESLIASLYADDTTVFLSNDDSYDLLMEILETWCLASGAKFNTKKSEVIPLGSQKYRQKLIESRRLNDRSSEIDEEVRIARDGEAVRILGAWPGNKLVEADTWSTVLDKIKGILSRWERTHPTMSGRCIISQVIIGGCTQYLMAAQGMPPRIEEKLDKIALDFIWAG
ncbi:hypothetical protein AURDEDRAFT_45626, partial [Auricularia subglabra TFB-10046 SS5]